LEKDEAARLVKLLWPGTATVLKICVNAIYAINALCAFYAINAINAFNAINALLFCGAVVVVGR
jgi:hypothetical protein